MKTSLIVAGALSAATLIASSAAAEWTRNPTRPGTTGNEFMISCYRGPWLNTISWDRPNAVFIDELVEYGYTPAQAIAIGKRVCRDEYGVGNEEYMRATLRKIVAEQPPLRVRKNNIGLGE